MGESEREIKRDAQFGMSGGGNRREAREFEDPVVSECAKGTREEEIEGKK